MTHEEIEKRVIELAAEHGDVDPATVSLDTHFENDLGYDSLTRVEFAMAVEDEFELQIPDEEMDAIRTVGQAVEAVVRKRAELGRSAEPSAPV